MLSVKELTNPSVKNNSIYLKLKLFVEVYRFRLNVFPHKDTLALWWCMNTEIENRNRVVEIENEPNRTEFEKSKLNQPYLGVSSAV